MALTVGTFASINTASVQLGAVGAWFAADVAANAALMLEAGALARKSRG